MMARNGKLEHTYILTLENNNVMKMKNKKYFSSISILMALVYISLVSCERDLSDEAIFATFPQNGDVFIDGFSSGLNYFPFVDAGADPEAFSVVTDDVFSGTLAMRFDVPAFGNGFVGAAFNTTANRDLSEFDALTFYAKASQAATIDAIGFGINDTNQNKFQVTKSGLSIDTKWKKYVIPIPDPSKLFNESGLLWLAEGASFEGDEGGYIFWLDEVKFEKLGTVAQPQPMILDGEDVVLQSFNGGVVNLASSGLSQTFNVSGENITVSIPPGYFSFDSTNPSVATVNESGLVNVLSQGSTAITATLGNVLAAGSLELTSNGDLPFSPTPTQPADDVRSIYSDSYTPVTGSNFNPGFGGSTTQTTEASLNGNNVQIYANNNFTGILFDNTVDGSEMTHLHVDVYTQSPGASVEIQIRDVGANGELETNVFNGFPDGDDKDFRFTADGLQVGQWTSFEIPLGGDISTQKNNLGAFILVGGPDFILDNIYFYKE